MMHLQVAKWGNSLAVRIPAEYARQIGAKEGDELEVHVGADGALNLRASTWSRKAFAQEIAKSAKATSKSVPVMRQLRDAERY